VLLDTITYRYSGHSPSDASSYRTAEEVQQWQAVDSLQAYRQRIVDAGVVEGEAMDEAQRDVQEIVFAMFCLAADLEASPRVPVSSELVSSVMFSNGHVEKSMTVPRTSAGCRRESQVQQIRGKVRTAFQDGKAVPR